MKNSIGRNIRRIRQSKKITQKQLSKLTGFSQNSISNHENGNRGIDEMDILMYAEALQVEPSDLFDKEDSDIPKIPLKPVPIVSKISAGEPIYSEQNIIDYTYVPEHHLKNGKEYFGLVIDGDSMNKEFNPGDTVIVEKDAVVESGQIGVVQINGYNATVKRVSYQKDMIILTPDSHNPMHKTQIYDENDEVTIIGRVVNLIRSY